MQAPKNIEEIYQEINNFAQSAEERSLIFRIPYITDLFAKIRGIHVSERKRYIIWAKLFQKIDQHLISVLEADFIPITCLSGLSTASPLSPG